MCEMQTDEMNVMLMMIVQHEIHVSFGPKVQQGFIVICEQVDLIQAIQVVLPVSLRDELVVLSEIHVPMRSVMMETQ